MIDPIAFINVIHGVIPWLLLFEGAVLCPPHKVFVSMHGFVGIAINGWACFSELGHIAAHLLFEFTWAKAEGFHVFFKVWVIIGHRLLINEGFFSKCVFLVPFCIASEVWHFIVNIFSQDFRI